MEEQSQNTLNVKQVIIIFASIILIVFISLLALTIYNAVKPNPYGDSIPIDGLSNLGIPEDDQDHITANLYETIKSNLAADIDVPVSGVKIRNDSIQSSYDKDEKIHTVDFIVDIDSIQQSYNIHVEWHDSKKYVDGYPYVITCLNESQEIIYPEFACSDDFSSTDFEIIIGNLPYYGKTENGYEYTIRIQEYTDGEKYLEVDVDSCGDQTTMDEALKSAKTWVQSLGIDEDSFPYYVPDYLCNGSAL